MTIQPKNYPTVSKRPTIEERVAEFEAKVEKIISILRKQGIWSP